MRNIAEWVYIAEGAKVIGDVQIGEDSSIWYNAVIRGDSNPTVIGENTNVQDNAVLHTSHGHALTIGDNVTIGHGAIVHGCTVGNNVLIGMGAIVLDGAVIEDNCIIGAGALVTQNKVIPMGSLALGNPAKVVRELKEEEKASIMRNADEYSEEARKYLQGEYRIIYRFLLLVGGSGDAMSKFYEELGRPDTISSMLDCRRLYGVKLIKTATVSQLY